MVAKAQNYITPHRKNVYWEWGHHAYFLDGGIIGVGKDIYWIGGTPHILCSWGE